VASRSRKATLPEAAGAAAAERRARVEHGLLTVAGALVAEIGSRPRPLSLAEALERDLGIGSLERVELLLRLERAFGIRLPDAVMAEAVTLDDLLAAILRAEPRRLPEFPAHPDSLVPPVAATVPPVDDRRRPEHGVARRIAHVCGRLIFTTYVAAIVLTTLPLLWLYLAMIPAGPHADRAVKWWSRMALAACGVRPRVGGLEHLRGLGAAILAVNHASYIDAVVLMGSIPIDFRFIAKRRLADYPLIGTVIRKARHATIEKGTVAQRLSGVDDLTGLLRKGLRVAVFPEGTFLRAPELLPFRLGAFKAAVEAGRPIVPIALRGTRLILPAGAGLLRRAPIEVTIGAPLVPTGKGWQEMVRLRDETRSTIARGAGEPERPV
jgi:1-acyl-sn-glycerol-3-phosphate acyltransferase